MPHRKVARLVLGTAYARLEEDRVAQGAAPRSTRPPSNSVGETALSTAGDWWAWTGRGCCTPAVGGDAGRRGRELLWVTAGLFNDVVDEGPGAFARPGSSCRGAAAVDPTV